ncbi:MAG: ABC transporter permease [Acidobacteria bacterium]|nr:ABC transporter permease [Acidobacteriota bacterium]
MRRDPLLAVTATLTLAAAIGAGTTVFSLVDTILLRPLPFPDAGRVYWLGERMGRNPMEVGLGPDYYSLRARRQVFAEVGAYDTLTVNRSGAGRPEQLDAALVTPSFFFTLGVRPAIGRTFDESEQGSKAPPIAVISDSFWRTGLNSDAAVLTRTLTLDGLPYRIVGVMPRGFDYPKGTQLWRPLPMDESSQLPRSGMRPIRLVRMIARIRPDFDERRFAAALPTLTRSLLDEYPREFANAGFLDNFTLIAEPLQRRVTGDVRPALYALSGAVLLLMMIACANLANLLLARAAVRRREFGVRLALGAGQGRLVRQLLGESCRLALPGGLAGAALAALAVRLLNTVQPAALNRYPAIALDLRTLGFSFALTLLTALIFGMAPVFAANSTNVQEALKSAGPGHSGGRAARVVRRLLIAAELAVSLVLLIGAGLLARSFLNLARVPLGFPAAGLLTLRVNLTGPEYREGTGQQRYYQDALARIAGLPGVRAAAVSTDLPLTGEHPFQTMSFQIAGRVPLPLAQRPETGMAIVSPDYFRALGVPLRAGRVFEATSDEHGAEAVIVNEAFARVVFPGEDPLGHVMLMGQSGRETRWTIVGVVGDVRGGQLGAPPPPFAYRCLCQQGSNRFLSRMGLLVRSTGDPSGLAHAVTAQLYAADSTQPVFDIRTMDERVAAMLAPERFQLWLIGVFTAIALVLAAAGVYGVMVCLVAQRTREIGIRIAVGARPEQVRRMVLAETVLLALPAAGAGLAAAGGLSRYLRSMLYGVAPMDPTTFAIAPALLILVALAASFVPARRAAAVDPLNALREE